MKDSPNKKENQTNSRRRFLRIGALSTAGALLGTPIVFADKMPKGLKPLALKEEEWYTVPGKHSEMVVLTDKPLTMEAKAHLLDDDITPADKFFVRNNGIPPIKGQMNLSTWTLTIEGESVKSKKAYSLADLKSKFKTYSYQLVIECAGNGRHESNPPAKGNQWTIGAVACAKWTGVRLKDILNDVGLKEDAVYVAYYGKDKHLSGEKGKVPISRGVPLSKAMEDEVLVAWAMNDKEIPLMNGYPLRVIFGGWPGSTSGKWLERIVVRNKEHDGPKMTGQSYRVPCKPVAPGQKVADEDMCIIESMPVKSLLTYPKTGAMLKEGKKLTVRGKAWAGDLKVSGMQVSIDFGASWIKCKLNAPANRLAWQSWSAELSFPGKGYYEVWARATDSNGQSQPMIVPGWNPRGYLNNACHRIALKVI